ncbi:hypothetical protein FACS1894166_11420 [Bacilli bacterium]|nr:hypothetical protein FACS1894166_11420 [Bacilli bacterium]
MNCNLDFVSSLNLEGADFANSTLLPSATDCTGNCHTGFSTFEGAEFDDLLTLSLKDCNFACAGMAPATTTNCGVGITARRTFYASNLENVASLDLSNCTFAVAHMDSGQQTQTATLTFGSADLSKCQTIN